MSKVKCKNVTLGDNADTTKNISINVPATADGTLTIETEAGTNLLTIDAAGQVKIGTSVAGRIVMGTMVNASGTAVDFTGLPSWVKRITMSLSGISTNGTSGVSIQLGDAGGVENTGYLGAGGQLNNAAASAASNATASCFIQDLAASNVIHGQVLITLVDATTNSWVMSVSCGFSNSATTVTCGFSKSLSATLDRVRLTTTNGTDTFDAGTVNIMYEG